MSTIPGISVLQPACALLNAERRAEAELVALEEAAKRHSYAVHTWYWPGGRDELIVKDDGTYLVRWGYCDPGETISRALALRMLMVSRE